MLLPVAKTRTLLATFCTANPSPLNCDQFQELCTTLDTECPPLAIILQELYKEEKQKTEPLPVYNFSFSGIWQKFLTILSSTSSASWVLRPTIIPLVLHLVETKKYTANAHAILSEFCPSLAYGLCQLPNSILPDPLADLLLAIVEVVKGTHPEITFVAAPPSNDNVFVPHSIADKPGKQVLSLGDQQLSVAYLKGVMEQVEKSHLPVSTGYDFSLLENYPLEVELDYTLSGVCYNWPKI